MPDSPVPRLVKAAPTKRFFISVLIKDISLLDAVVELVDNSVDSARGSGNLVGVHIEIGYGNGMFSIRDNAAGISIQQATNYAFRFGRADGAPPTPGAVGEFGVGMKRAFFKIGRYFTVVSNTVTDHFSLHVDVDDWEREDDGNPNSWNFAFDESGDNTQSAQTGTQIEVRKLHEYTAEEFGSATFLAQLVKALKERHEENLSRGLQITVNNASVQAESATLFSSAAIKPIVKAIDLEISGKLVKVKLFAGIGEESLVDAGWYVYCNGRQIEHAEKTEKTGWNSAIDGDKTPKPHWQFRRFRGYIFFDSAFPDVLPWNTTKTGLDTEAPAYRRVKSEIAGALRQVIGFLNALDSEAGGQSKLPDVDTGPTPLTDIVEAANAVGLASLGASDEFTFDRTAVATEPEWERIQYYVKAERYELVRERLGAQSKTDVGRKTFDYYAQSEGLE
jgi:hypothetical protein